VLVKTLRELGACGLPLLMKWRICCVGSLCVKIAHARKQLNVSSVSEYLTATDLSLVKFSSLYGTRKFVTLFTTVHHLSLSPLTLIQSTSAVVFLRSVLILFFHLCRGLASDLFPSGVPIRCQYACICSPTRATHPVHLYLDVFT
jgi:hypothetical protein